MPMMDQDKIIELITNEDKKHPLTDEAIGETLGLRRDEVTVLRRKMRIPDSRERLRSEILAVLQQMIQNHPSLSDRELTEQVNKLGYAVSRYLVSDLRRELAKRNSNDCFEHIVGYNGSLREAIERAKAAILYPDGLHTLILGATGTGKTLLAEAMYSFAKKSGVFLESAPFVVFNCADYAETPHLLLSHLFGHKKGSFTGADSDAVGLVEQADNGILFLDEIHRLPPEGQEMLYTIIDQGRFRRLGETSGWRKVKIRLIAATTENINHHLLEPFRRRIPMIIHLPALFERPASERITLIKTLFQQEAEKTKKEIRVTPEVLVALLTYKCPGNIGQLKSDIQVTCARSYLDFGNERSQEHYLKIDRQHLPEHVIQEREAEMSKHLVSTLTSKGLRIFPSSQAILGTNMLTDYNAVLDDIYEYIKQRVTRLKQTGVPSQEIAGLVRQDLESRFSSSIREFCCYTDLKMEELRRLVGADVVRLAQNCVNLIKEHGGNPNEDFLYCLALHIHALSSRKQNVGDLPFNPDEICREHPKEWMIAQEVAKLVSEGLGIELPGDEVCFLTMYTNLAFAQPPAGEQKIGIVVVTHGSAGQAMLEIANKLLGTTNATCVTMPLEERPELALQRTITAAREVNMGKGVLLLVDLGSLVTFGELVTQATGIPTKTVTRVDTAMLLEAVRKACLPEMNLDNLARILQRDVGYAARNNHYTSTGSKPKVIVTICITGEGTAVQIKKYLESAVPEIAATGIAIVPVSALHSSALADIEKSRDIIAIIGSVKPESNSTPFFSIKSVLTGEAIPKIRSLLGQRKVSTSPLARVLFPELVLVRREFSNKTEVIDALARLLHENGFTNADFQVQVYRREMLGSTAIGNQIAIPHAPPGAVVKPAIAIATLSHPLDWTYNDDMVDKIFMLALKEDCQDIVSSILGIANDKSLCREIVLADDPTTIINLMILAE